MKELSKSVFAERPARAQCIAIAADERGQTSLFMALFVSTMILLFAFTTNIGMLVHAKINLQNAADAAAYSGAAVQARQLTAVGYLNYEMRRALKEFLFYYTIRSDYDALPCFPLNKNGLRNPGFCPQVTPEVRYEYAFFDPRPGNNANETGGPYLPSVCIIFSELNNYCQKAGVPGIPVFPSGGGWGVADPIVAAVRAATNQIIDKKLEDCFSRTDINRQFLIAWLFNLYPFQDGTSLLRTGNDQDDPFPFTPGLERLGILPRMALLRARIDNYEEMLNMNLGTEGIGPTMDETAINTIKGKKTATKSLDYFERSLQAFLSAKNNLPGAGGNNGIFANIELTELIPDQPGSTNTSPNLMNPPVLARFNDITASVSFANSKFETNPGGDKGNCSQSRELRTIPRFPFGITKDPSILTYYAIRLQAKARLLFSPFGDHGIVTLSAYSAAKPFGSRIGKDIGLDPDHLMIAQAKLDSSFGPTVPFPNVLVSEDDKDSNTAGFTRNGHLGYIRQAMAYTNRLDIGPRLAGAYAPWEVGYYTVPANFKAPEDIGLFEDNPVYNGKYFALSAPLFPVNQNVGSSISFLRDRVGEYLIGDLKQRDTLLGPFKVFLDGVMSDDKWAALNGYLESTKQVLMHHVPDPLLNDEPELLAFVRSEGARYTVAGMPLAQRRQFTSWNNQKTASDGVELGIPPNSELGVDIGRSGYSVRFVSFKLLQAGGKATNDANLVGSQWSNPFQRLNALDEAAKAKDDINKLDH